MITIRQGNVKDIGAIVAFQLKMAGETEGLILDKDTVAKGVQAVLNDQAKGRYYIAHQNNEILGMFLTIPEWSDWRNGTVLWIHSLYVIPKEREKGVFKKMFNFLKSMVEKSPEFIGLRLYVDKKNTSARKVYEKLGMNKDHYLLYEWLKR